MARSQMPDKKLRIVRERPVQNLRVSPPIGFYRGQLKAQYDEQQKVWRIVYVANDRWQLERFWAPDSNNTGVPKEGGWQWYQRPTDYETAHAQLKRRDQMQQASA